MPAPDHSTRRRLRVTRLIAGTAVGATLIVIGLSLGVTGAFSGSVTTAPSTAAAPGVAPATAEPVATALYVALGDSFAAGQGGDDPQGACRQSTGSYPRLLGAETDITLSADASCSGAVTADIGGQLAPLNAATTLVTVTVGGNDLDFASVMDSCRQSAGVSCQADIDAAAALLTAGALSDRLGTAYGQIATAAPNAHILVTGYPYLYAPSDDAQITQLNLATSALNSTIRGAVTSARTAYPAAQLDFVDVTDAFTGHGLGSLDTWIGDTGAGAFHPTAAGYAAYARVLRSAF